MQFVKPKENSKLLHPCKIIGSTPLHKSPVLFAGSDNKLFIWNVGTSDALIEIDCLPDIPLCASWNWDGSRFVVSCKDKKVRIIDPRTGDVLKV